MSFDSINMTMSTNMFYRYPFVLSDMKNGIFELLSTLYDRSMAQNIRYFLHLTINREEFPTIIIDSNPISDEEKDYLLERAYKADEEIVFFNPMNMDEVKTKFEKFYNTRLVYKLKNILREAGSREDSIIYRFIDKIYANLFCDIIK